MSKRLNLFYQNHLVGILSEDLEERLSFKYSDSWLDNEESFAISINLPLSKKAYGHIQAKSFFENLLPEGEVKAAIESLSKENVTDEFHFLKEYGIDCAGAFILSSLESVQKEDRLKSSEIKVKEIYEYLSEKRPLMSAIINEKHGRFSLAGAQDKFPIIYKDKKIFIPLNGEPTNYILKPRVRYHKDTEDTPYNEHFCMQFAKKIGLNVPNTILLEGEFPLYLVERFDRKSLKDKTIRIHQEDFCQAQGITSRKKYEADGGPKLSDNYRLIKSNSVLPLKDLSQFLKWFWFNLLIGNNDCHSKNLSFLYSEKGLRLSPFYDLLCTSIYKDLTSQFSYKVGGQAYWYKLKERNFVRLANELEIKVGLLFKEGKMIIDLASKKMNELVEDFEKKYAGVKTASLIRDEFNKRVDHLTLNVESL